MQIRDKFYIDGHWVAPAGAGSLGVTDASTGAPWATIPEGNEQDASVAVAAARRAFDGWSRTSPEERAAALEQIAAELGKRTGDIAKAIACEVGMPLKMSTRLQVESPAAALASFATSVRSMSFEQRVGPSLVVREAAGVVAAITPWNFPLNQIVLKVGAALAAGCTVVLKPSEVAPINAFLFMEAVHAAGLPAGVLNMITGTGPVVGEALASHPDVDVVSFTGSTRAGRRVAELAGQGIRKVTLELGGKSASVVLDDADFARAIKASVNNCFLNSGQTCSAQTRLLVPRSRLEEAVGLARQSAERFTVGPAFSDDAMLGPLISAIQQDRVLTYIRRGIDDGAELITGGLEPPSVPAENAGGYFVKPTVFVVKDHKTAIAQEEIFGPVLVIIPYEDEDDAVRIANDTPYGLGGGVWSADEARALAVARRLRTGQVDINGGCWNPQAPFGGFKQSGIGRENGTFGIEEFLEYKAINLKARA